MTTSDRKCPFCGKKFGLSKEGPGLYTTNSENPVYQIRCGCGMMSRMFPTDLHAIIWFETRNGRKGKQQFPQVKHNVGPAVGAEQDAAKTRGEVKPDEF